MKKKILPVIFILLIFSLSIYSQTQSAQDASKLNNQLVSGVFERKSITILPLTLPQSQNYYDEIVKGVDKIQPTGRFDNNFISKLSMAKAQGNFIKQNLQSFNYDKDKEILIQSLINSGVLTEIIKSSSNLDSLRARIQRSKKRIVISALEDAKIREPKVGDILKLISNTFIAIPLLNNIETKNNITNAVGNFLWFQVDISNVGNDDWDGTMPKLEKVDLKLVNQKDASISSNFALLSDELFSSDEEEKNLPADKKAARNFGKAIINMAMTMEEFKVRATIQDVEDGIRIDIGKREGVYLDQGYKVFEQRLTPDNKPYSQYMGFIRVDKVADNEVKFDALSSCYTIIPGGFEAGHIITSHDQSFDILIRPQYKQVFIPKEFGYGIIYSNSGVFKSDVSEVYNAELAVLVNAARVVNMTQFFIGVSGFIGLPNYEKVGTISGLEINTPLIYGGNLVIQKKFWLYRTALSFEAQVGAQTLSLTGKVKDIFNKEVEWEYNTGWNLSAAAGVGFEFAISPDINFGLEVGYSYVLSPLEVKIKVGDKEETYKKDDNKLFWNTNKLDDLQLGGLKLGAKLSISLPPLF